MADLELLTLNLETMPKNKIKIKGQANPPSITGGIIGSATTLSSTSNSGTNSIVTTKISGWFNDNFRMYYVDENGKKNYS